MGKDNNHILCGRNWGGGFHTPLHVFMPFEVGCAVFAAAFLQDELVMLVKLLHTSSSRFYAPSDLLPPPHLIPSSSLCLTSCLLAPLTPAES